MSDNNSSEKRFRTWCCVAYPDSAPPDWRERLDSFHIQWAESPLHEFDVNADGELKKPHWHLVITFEGKKSYEQICSILSCLNCPAPEHCHDIRGATRYLVHLDNPEKYQYDINSIVAHGGFDLRSALQPTASERYEYISEMISYCKEANITEFQDLMDYAMNEHRSDWFPLLCDSCSFVLNQYLKSARHRNSK